MMSSLPKTLSLAAIASSFVFAAAGADSGPGLNTVILDATSVENLGVESVVAQRRSFEETLFALGRIEPIPSHRGVVSSRIAGRVVSLSAFEGDEVTQGEVVAVLESRQSGNPPPKIELKAPLSGLVSHGHVRLGEPAEPDEELFEVIDLTSVYAIARVPEDEAHVLQPSIEARIRVAALPGEVFSGKLLRLSTSIDPESGTVGAVFAIQNPGKRIRPSMRAEFSIVTRKRENVLSVPRSALVSDAVGQSVFVRDFGLPNAFVKSVVQTGMRNDEFVEIRSGLFPGDEVVIHGAYPLAYAGAGTVSLKEALDAAHGHEHNEDGSEMTAEDRRKARAAAYEGTAGGASGGANLFLVLLASILLFLVILSQWQLYQLRRERGGSDA